MPEDRGPSLTWSVTDAAAQPALSVVADTIQIWPAETMVVRMPKRVDDVKHSNVAATKLRQDQLSRLGRTRRRNHRPRCGPTRGRVHVPDVAFDTKISSRLSLYSICGVKASQPLW